jgi:hypothetical protein
METDRLRARRSSDRFRGRIRFSRGDLSLDQVGFLTLTPSRKESSAAPACLFPMK